MKHSLQATLARGLLALLLLPGLARAQAGAQGAENAATQVVQAASNPAGSLDPEVPWYQHIQAAAQAYGVDVHLLQALVKVESNFDASAVSRAGAIGLMQIMPVTALSVAGLRGTRQSLRQQLQDPAINVHAGALYVRNLMDVFSQRLDLVLAAYNAGVGNVRKAGNRVPPNGETPRFVKKVSELYADLKAAAGVSAAAPLAPDEPAPGAASPLPPVQ